MLCTFNSMLRGIHVNTKILMSQDKAIVADLYTQNVTDIKLYMKIVCFMYS